jgi:Carboxypeptidase regulatory-like domain
MQRRSILKRLCFLTLILLIATAIISAQSTTTGAITGRVVDPTMAVIRNATVTLKNRGTGAVQTTATGSSGTYLFAFLDPGNYTVSTSAPGFETASQRVAVGVGLMKTLDFRLPIGKAKQSVTFQLRSPPSRFRKSPIRGTT